MSNFSQISLLSLSLTLSLSLPPLKRWQTFSLSRNFFLESEDWAARGAKWSGYGAGLGFPGVPGNGPRVSLSEDLFFPAKAGRERWEGTGGNVINWLHDKTVLVPIRRPSPDPPWLLLKIWGHATHGDTRTRTRPASFRLSPALSRARRVGVASETFLPRRLPPHISPLCLSLSREWKKYVSIFRRDGN